MYLRVVAVVISVLLGSLQARVDAEEIARQPTRIVAQELARALQTLAKERNVQLVYRSELVADRHTEGASGVLTLEEALTQILRGSGLVHRYLDTDAITLVRVE
jgi:iron complex outermembrane recepter protein